MSGDVQDVQGTIIQCQQIAAMIAHVLGTADNEKQKLSMDSLLGLGAVAERLADELRALETAYVREANELERAATKGRG